MGLMRLRWAASLGAVVIAVWLGGCGGSGQSPFNATPVIGCASGTVPGCGLFPPNVTAGSQNFTLFVSGTGFIATSQGLWNGATRPTTLNNTTGQLAIAISAADVAAAGTVQVSVMNPAPGGGTSQSAAFVIEPAQNGGPTISSVSPATVSAGGNAFTLTVTGANFAANYVVTWNGSWRTTAYTSATQLQAQITATDIAAAGCGSVSVLNPAPPGTDQSPSVDVTITGSGAVTCGSANPADKAFPQVVSVNSLGGPADGPSDAPAMSGDGRYVAFYSAAKNLMGQGAASGNIFVRDTCLGASNCSPRTIAADLGLDGSAPNGPADDQVALSADGRFVAFASHATNLVPGSSAGPSLAGNIYLRDLCVGASAAAGCTPQTALVSVGADGAFATGDNVSPSISADGRFVAFVSLQGDASGGAASTPQVLVRDTCVGSMAASRGGASCVPTTFAASAGGDQPAISADGRYVAFRSPSSTAVGSGAALPTHIVLWDACLGSDAPAACVRSAVTISLGPDGSSLDALNGGPSISGDGRFVVFESEAIPVSPGQLRAGRKIYLHDTCLGQSSPEGCTPSTTLISLGADGVTSSDDSSSPWISPSGRYISYVAGAGQGAASSSPSAGLLAVRDTCFGATTSCTPRTYQVAASAMGIDSQALPLPLDIANSVPLTADGRFATFFTPYAAPAASSSGHGDVFLTTTPF